MRVYLLFVFVGIFAASFGVNAKEKPALRPAKKNVSATKKGFDVAKRADAKDAGFGSYSANAKMELKDKRGKPRTSRSFHFKFKEVPSDADKTITKFLSPANVKGTILLTHGHKDRDDDQWIYLSALKRDKRILSSGQTGAFLGSEFSFEDMRSPIIEKFRYKYLRSENEGGQDCHVIERIPKDKKSGYKKQLVWLDKAELRIYRIDFFDRRMKLSKRFTAKGYKQYKTRYWRPDNVVMKNTKNGRYTEITYSDYNFGVKLTDADFHKSVLKRP